MFSNITKKPFWLNVLAVILIALIILFIFFLSLDWLTNHGKAEKVPNITGQNVIAATKMLEAKGFKVEITDSLFVDSIARQSVIKQIPEGDAVVKEGRTIYLTVNRTNAPMIDMPNFVGFSIRSAMLMLQSLNLKLGDTTFKPDIAKNSVLEQWYRGSQIKAGTKIAMGSTIDFVLGSGLGTEDIDVPDLVGLNVATAISIIQSKQLGLGPIVARGEVIKDTMNAFVVDQNPKVFSEPYPGQKVQNKLRSGQIVDLFISKYKPVIDSTLNAQ